MHEIIDTTQNEPFLQARVMIGLFDKAIRLVSYAEASPAQLKKAGSILNPLLTQHDIECHVELFNAKLLKFYDITSADLLHWHEAMKAYVKNSICDTAMIAIHKEPILWFFEDFGYMSTTTHAPIISRKMTWRWILKGIRNFAVHLEENIYHLQGIAGELHDGHVREKFEFLFKDALDLFKLKSVFYDHMGLFAPYLEECLDKAFTDLEDYLRRSLNFMKRYNIE